MAQRSTAMKQEQLKPSPPEVPVRRDEFLRRLGQLQELTLGIDRVHTRDEILDAVRAGARKLLLYQTCFIALLNRAATHYAVATLSPVADATELHHKLFSLEEGMPGWAIKHGASIIEDIASGPCFHHAIEGRLQELGVASQLIVPLRYGNDVIGALAFGSITPAGFDAHDEAIAQTLATVLAAALRNAEMVDGARKRIAQIELINALSSRLTAVLNLEDLLTVAASTIQKTFGYFDVTIFLVADDQAQLVLEAHAGSFVDFLPHGYRQQVGSGLIGWVARHGERILSNDVAHDPRYLAYEYHNTKSELALPIKVDSAVVGVLNVEDTKLQAFDETDAVVLSTLCDQLGTAIKNAKLYEEVRKANMKLLELDKMKSEFLGIVSHDFRSPLSSIMLAGRALLKNDAVQEQPRVKEYLQLIVAQASRLSQLAEDTLSITKLESGHLSYHFKIVNIERLVQDAVQMVKFSAKHTFDCVIDPNALFIKGDQSKLRQVIQNLVNNAVKYSPRGGKVRIVADEHGADEILIAVSDEGIGIPQEQMGKLFAKFSRAESAESKEIKGAGLGLWICREVVQAHGGKIWIESAVGKGTTIKLTLSRATE